MTRAEDLEQAYAALTPTVQAAVDELTGLYAEVERIEDENKALADDNFSLRQANTKLMDENMELIRLHNTDHAIIDELRARIAELEAQLPPEFVRVLDSYGPPGGGGINMIECLPDGSMMVGTDVGACVRFAPGSWEGQKWNLGLTGARHIASLTPDDDTVLVHGGSPGSQEGVSRYVAGLGEWSVTIPGSTKLFVNSQNSYGDPNSTQPAAWKFGYGTWEQRSVGRLTWMRDNGDLVCGQFGYAGVGKGGVAVLSNGVKRIIPGTENWAVRAVQDIGNDQYLVSVEKQRVSNTALPTPGGLWNVNVVTNAISRLTGSPDTPEHIDSSGTDTVVACRNAGIWLNGQDITFNLPRASEWYSVAINDRGDILAGCMDPQMFDGRYASFVLLRAGSQTWENLTPPPLGKGEYFDTLNSAEPFAAVNRGNTLGLAGATVTDVAWRGDTPVCSASGIVWAYVDGETKPAPGSWILVNRGYDRTPDGYEAFATSDFRALWRKPGTRWEKAPFSGGNDGADVAWEAPGSGVHLLHYRGPGGERWVFNADSGASSVTSLPMPPHNPEAPMTDEKRAEILATVEVQQFGERYGTFAIDEETLLVFGHGAAVSRMVQA